MRSSTPPGLSAREPKWQKYTQEVHTLSVDLAKVAAKAHPAALVTYHRIYHMEIQDNTRDVEAEMARRNTAFCRKSVMPDMKVPL